MSEIAAPPPSKPHPDNCQKCHHIHLNADRCYYSTARDNLCLCAHEQENRTMSRMKSNGKDVEIIHGRTPAKRKKTAAKVTRDTKTKHLPGMEPKTIATVRRAIEDYVEARDQRMALTKIEVEKKAKLMDAMKKAGITHYSVDGREADLDVEETVKARIAPEEAEEAEERELSGGRSRSRGAAAEAQA